MRLGSTETQSMMLNTERRSNIEYATQRYTENRRLGHKYWAKRVILISRITQITTNCILVFHALSIGTWAVTAKREPLSVRLSLIITAYLLRFLLVPTVLSVTRPLSAPPCRFILRSPLCFVRSASAFHTWSSKAANKTKTKSQRK